MDTATKLADELLDAMLESSPLSATLLGIPGYDDRLADHSEGAERASLAKVTGIAERARALRPGALERTDRVTRAVVVQQAEAAVDQLATRSVEYTVTDTFVAPAAELLSLLPMVPVAGDERAAAYLTRLAAIPAFLATVAERHRAGTAAGRVPVARLVEATVAYLDRYLANPDADPLRRPQPVPDDTTFTAERERLLVEVVRPAFARYREVLATEVAPHGRPSDRAGLCWLPDGERAYASLARVHTTTSRSPDELHQTGLELIAKLAGEYVAIGSRLFGTRNLHEIFDRLRTDPALRWNSGDELLEAAREAIHRAERAAPEWFGRLPGQQCTVEPVPAVEAPGAPAGYYLLPSLDGQRPGIYFANTDRAGERFRYIAEATAFHEGVPGHHFQLAIAQELTELPLLRRIAPVTAYGEGWGLYAERLADEMGLYSGDIALLGMLTLDSMRAARLVVDTGLHAKGWSRQQAVDYMRDHSAMAQVEIDTEVDRYIAEPGQALAYMVGRLEIQRLRAEAERALGEGLDLRAFHDLVLGGGPLPLAVLAEVVEEWIAPQS
jgi:uncharacterized protein (DUF885 family)